MTAERIYSIATSVWFYSAVIAAILGATSLLASWVQYKANDKISQKQAERVLQLETDLEHAKAEVRIADANLLAEQRLTANQRWRFTRVEQIVLPRAISTDLANSLSADLRGAGITPVNLIYSAKPESTNYALQLIELLKDAHLLNQTFSLSAPYYGVGVLVVDENGQKLMQVLQRHRVSNAAVISKQGISLDLFPSLRGIPSEQSAIIVGDQDPMFVPVDGQPGEGIDEHGRPTPAPR